MLSDVSRDFVVRLRLSPAEHAAWTAAAKKAEITMSEWIRRRVQGTTVIEAPAAPVVKSTKKGGK